MTGEGETHHPLCPVKKRPKTEEVSEEEVDHVVTFQKMAHQFAKVEQTESEGTGFYFFRRIFFGLGLIFRQKRH